MGCGFIISRGCGGFCFRRCGKCARLVRTRLMSGWRRWMRRSARIMERRGSRLRRRLRRIDHRALFWVRSPRVHLKRYSKTSFCCPGFGQGPRNCIGMRFALITVKFALVQLLSKYNLRTCLETTAKVVRDPKAMFSSPLHPIWLRLEPREDL